MGCSGSTFMQLRETQLCLLRCVLKLIFIYWSLPDKGYSKNLVLVLRVEKAKMMTYTVWARSFWAPSLRHMTAGLNRRHVCAHPVIHTIFSGHFLFCPSLEWTDTAQHSSKDTWPVPMYATHSDDSQRNKSCSNLYSLGGNTLLTEIVTNNVTQENMRAIIKMGQIFHVEQPARVMNYLTESLGKVHSWGKK